MEFDMDIDNEAAKELREEVLDCALKVYHAAAGANGWTEPPKDIKEAMDEIFRLVTIGFGIKE